MSQGTHYHRIAGQSLGRLAALSDGIFAVAMTLLVLDLKVPAEQALHARFLWADGAVGAERPVWHLLGHVGPQLLICFLGFLTLGMFWVGQQAQLGLLERGDRNLAWIHVLFLFGVSLVPFATALLAAFTASRLALLVYWTDLLFLGVVQLAGLRYAERAGLLRDGTAPADVSAIRRRIAVVQGLYALSVVLCVVDTYVSIALIILLQFNSAISPPIRPLNRF
ncbi:TMEM175 family protein [Actinomadura rupiterrae]|uniref:TMEM175 family protein n=1 Tax=Actinomadura rupiterrae TaxID=559627 RepID=UPI0020A5D19C|nr:TMEM175 family protein [Actinomadura rupiterrae]MCP2342478.1 putative membrane protein [Actinomadura rupiterrae]